MVISGTFTSVWDDGVEIATPATLDTETGEVIAIAAEVENLDILQREYFTDKNENEYEICPECHEYILKSVMKDGIGHCYDEVKVCSDTECDNQ